MTRLTLSEPTKSKKSSGLSGFALPAGIFGLAAITAVIAANLSVSVIESASETAVKEELQLSDLGWADVDAAGLNVFLIGTAPNEAARFRALTSAGKVVDAARVIDQMDVVESKSLAPPRFSIEILRNDAGISLIGLIPESTDRDTMLETMTRVAGDESVSDLMETARHPMPEGWEDAIDFAMDALRILPRSKISVAADEVAVTAMTDSRDEKARVETELSRSRPDDLKITLDISAPRPVITPFTLRFIKTEEATRFDACSADSEAARERIIAAARAAGVEGQTSCTIGLGVPTTRWADAAELAIKAVDDLGGGTVTIADASIALIALEGTPQAQFDQVVGVLENNLPGVFDLSVELPASPESTAEGPPEFLATLSPEGAVALQGRVSSQAARITADSYAKAAFGSNVVRMSARVVDDLPRTWPVRVLAGIEALSQLGAGSVVVTPDTVTVRGKTGNANAQDIIARLLVDKLGEDARFSVDVSYDEALDPDAALPTPQECKARIVRVVGDRKIRFEPGSDALDSTGRQIMDDIAEVLQGCGEISLEIQGHTDSQGREVMNQQLSQSRAETVLRELRNRRVLTSTFSAVGYGEANPIDTNDTEEGREANRRIEFVLIEPGNDTEEALANQEQTESEDAQSE
ncbi:OmpA family protein [Primorskyibacter sp. S187A]|uniref:OmpA family protein n=1 Tax=Primorskyibacter sp. S187A TaxID=3415130 RepID=UPI003C7E40AA